MKTDFSRTATPCRPTACTAKSILCVPEDTAPRILELGCGTGVDTAFLARSGVRVHAIDVSPRMVGAARQRVEQEELSGRVTFEVCALEHVADVPRAGLYDGAFSDFGAINCLQDPSLAARNLAALLRPGARLVLCFLGKFCPWESIYHLFHARPGKAFRRLREGRSGIETVVASAPTFRVCYPSIAELAAAFAGDFDLVSFRSIGILVPPSYLEPWARTRQRTLLALASLDELCGQHACRHWTVCQKRYPGADQCAGN